MPSRLSLYSSYYVDTKIDPAAVTNYGGLFPYLDLMLLAELPRTVMDCLPKAGALGWQHAEHVAALLALNLTGGDRVDDLGKLEGDPGISLYMGQIANALELQAKADRFARGGDRDIPSLTCVREWLDLFHNAAEEGKRQEGVAFIPAPNEALLGLWGVKKRFIKSAWDLQCRSGRPAITRATLDTDATFMETQKQTALTCYKKYDAYSGLTVRWDEMGVVVWDEFRDGNVPPSYRNRDALRESIEYLNDELGIMDVWVRSDAAACQHGVLRLLNEWRVGGEACPVRFAIGYVKTKEFREEVRRLEDSEWRGVFDNKRRLMYEVADVGFVSNREALAKGDPYRHIVVRRPSKQGVLPGMDVGVGDLADEETVEMSGRAWHIFAIISNISEWLPEQIVEWYNGRCSKGEAIHSILKSDLAGGQLPSSKFGANAAWWSIVVLAWNLHALLERLALPAGFVGSRFKRLRYHLINVPARMIQHARQCCIRYFKVDVMGLVHTIRGALAEIAMAPG